MAEGENFLDEEKIPLHQDRGIKADKEKSQKVRDAQLRRDREDFAFVFGTPQGNRVLKRLAVLCGHNNPVVGANPAFGMDVLHGTFLNAARLGVYLEFRKFIREDILVKAESGKPEEPEIE